MMKLLKCIPFVIVSLLNSVILLGQVGSSNGNDSLSLQYQFEEFCKYNNNAKDVDTLCATVCIFTKFNIDSSGNATNIEFNIDAPVLLRKFITNFLKTVNKKWMGINKQRKILLPVLFNTFNRKCTSTQNLYFNLLSMLQFGEFDPGRKGMPMSLKYKNEPPLECTVINTITYASPY